LDSSPFAESLALLDIGSNALRCLVARLDDRPGFEIALRQRVLTRLGDSPSGLLPSAAIDATLRAARRFLKKVRRKHEGARVLALATAAVRDAENRDALLAPLAELGVQDVRILSGSEEGRLGAEAACRAWPIERGLIVDVGGGSLQVTGVIDGVLQESASVPLGVVRLTTRFIDDDPASPRELASLRAEIQEELAPLLRAVPADGVLLASGGVVSALGRLTLGRRAAALGEVVDVPTHGSKLDRSELRLLRAWLEPMPLRERAAAPGLKPERADVILTGAILLEELLVASGFEALTISRTSVREGVLWREAQKLGSSERGSPEPLASSGSGA
jgi:exopolyphosphatase / guanosine-5'-triphosphate,3'-diphosphate pyrophosphatase